MTNQRICEKLVERDVIYCVSSLVYELTQKEEYWDDLMPILSQEDYEEPVLWYIDNHLSIVEAKDYLINIEGSMPFAGNAKDQLKKWLDDPEKVWEFADEFCIDPDQHEALEHWIVTEWFAEKLEARGEMVGEFMGLTIWGRGTSGQAIYMDSVIKEIASDMGILEGQTNEWKIN